MDTPAQFWNILDHPAKSEKSVKTSGSANNPFNMKPTSLAAVVAQATKRAKFMNKTYGKLHSTILSQASHGLSEAEVKSLITEECKLDQ